MIFYVDIVIELEPFSRHGCNKRMSRITNRAKPTPDNRYVLV